MIYFDQIPPALPPTKAEREARAKADAFGCCCGWVIGGLLLIALTLCSCRTREVVREVPVVVEHTTEHVRTDVVRDTIHWRDSVYHLVMGDTVIIERWHTRERVELRATSDTVRDTVPVVTEVKVTEVKEVNVLRWWQTMLMWLGAIGAAIVGLKIYKRVFD